MVGSLPVQAAAGRMLYDTSDMDKGTGEDAGTAAMLEGTQLCCTCQLRDILHCLGGVAVLLPLLAQLGGDLSAAVFSQKECGRLRKSVDLAGVAHRPLKSLHTLFCFGGIFMFLIWRERLHQLLCSKQPVATLDQCCHCSALIS